MLRTMPGIKYSGYPYLWKPYNIYEVSTQALNYFFVGIISYASGTDAASLSERAGQKRAAAIATILSMSPKIITLDEPDGSLDPRNRNNLIKLLGSLSQTLIIATCNMNFAAALADRTVLLDKGRIIADGEAQKIMSDSKLMSEHGLETPGKR